MNNNFAALKKILVIVPVEQCDTFRANHMGDNIGPSDRYWNKVVFLSDKKEIYTHGILFGGSDANAVTFEGNETQMSVALDAQSGIPENYVGNMYVMSTSYSFTFGGKEYNLDGGDNVIITTVDAGKVTGITAVERNLDGAVTTVSTLTVGKLVVGSGNQSIQTTNVSVGTDESDLSTPTANTLATEQAVASYVANTVEPMNSQITYLTTAMYEDEELTANALSELRSKIDRLTNDFVSSETEIEQHSINILDFASRIASLERVAYVSIADDLHATLETDGLVTGTLLTNVINSLNPWQEY